MAEKDTIFSSKVKNSGVFNFSQFYQFCHAWLTDETQLAITESKYKENLKGDAKDIEIKWEGARNVTDYFMFSIEVKFIIKGLTQVELTRDGKKIKTNKGSVEVVVSSSLVRDYKGKFEINAFQKFLRSIYEKWVIPSRIEQYKGTLIRESDEFLNQVKAYLDLEGKK